MTKKNEKKVDVDDKEHVIYNFFVENKKNVKFEGSARFCILNTNNVYFGPYDDHENRTCIKNDPNDPL